MLARSSRASAKNEAGHTTRPPDSRIFSVPGKAGSAVSAPRRRALAAHASATIGGTQSLEGWKSWIDRRVRRPSTRTDARRGRSAAGEQRRRRPQVSLLMRAEAEVASGVGSLQRAGILLTEPSRRHQARYFHSYIAVSQRYRSSKRSCAAGEQKVELQLSLRLSAFGCQVAVRLHSRQKSEARYSRISNDEASRGDPAALSRRRGPHAIFAGAGRDRARRGTERRC